MVVALSMESEMYSYLGSDGLLDQKLEYIDNELFEDSTAADEILGPMPESDETAASRPPRGLPPYLASLYEVPLLSKPQEQHLFRKMNYLKYRAAQLRDGSGHAARA